MCTGWYIQVVAQEICQGANRVPVLREPMFWERRWLISQRTQKSYIASGLRDLIKYQNQAKSVVLMFGMQSRLQTRFSTWFAAASGRKPPWLPTAPKHRLKPPHLLPEDLLWGGAVSGSGLGLLGAPQVHVDISFWLNCAESTFRLQGVRIPALASSGCERAVFLLGPLGRCMQAGRCGARTEWLRSQDVGLRFVSESESENSPFVWNSQHMASRENVFWKLRVNRNTYFWVLTVAWNKLILKKAVSKVDPIGYREMVFYLVASGEGTTTVLSSSLTSLILPLLPLSSSLFWNVLVISSCL